jgi:CDP-diacylglycerol pyrophosphatase
MRRPLVFAIACHCLLSALAAHAANRDALRQIVQEECLPHWQQQHSAAPCERVGDGYAVLADRKGGAHFLLIPTPTIAGMESPELLDARTPNYFDAAFRARDKVAAVVGHPIERSAIGLAVNPRRARSQDQLHIHIECIRADVAAALKAAAPRITTHWSPLDLAGSPYQALRIMGEELDRSDPIKLLADELPAAKSAMGDYTLIVAGMDLPQGPGFVVLAGTQSAGELLLDSTCAIAGSATGTIQ